MIHESDSDKRTAETSTIERQTKALERIAAAQERQADAAEALTGLSLLLFDYLDDMPEYSVEALYEEAVYFGTGGESA